MYLKEFLLTYKIYKENAEDADIIFALLSSNWKGRSECITTFSLLAEKSGTATLLHSLQCWVISDLRGKASLKTWKYAFHFWRDRTELKHKQILCDLVRSGRSAAKLWRYLSARMPIIMGFNFLKEMFFGLTLSSQSSHKLYNEPFKVFCVVKSKRMFWITSKRLQLLLLWCAQRGLIGENCSPFSWLRLILISKPMFPINFHLLQVLGILTSKLQFKERMSVSVVLYKALLCSYIYMLLTFQLFIV